MTSQGTMVRGGSLVVVAVVVVVVVAVVAATATVVVAVAVAVVVVVVATVVVAMPVMAARRETKNKRNATCGRDLQMTTSMTFTAVTGARSKMRTRCTQRHAEGYTKDSPSNQIWPGHQIWSRCAWSLRPPPHQ